MQNVPSSWTFLELMMFFGPKVLFALLCGGIIGLERELKNKSAGIKTNMLICAGAALYTAVSVLISMTVSESGYFGDPGRIAAQIVSGIGFLGGGAIIQSRGTVVGLTTAATIWVVAAIGICVGLGYLWVGVSASVMVVIILTIVTYLESNFLGSFLTFACEVQMEDPDGSIRKTLLKDTLQENDLTLMDFHITPRGKLTQVWLQYRGNQNDHKRFLLQAWSMPGVREVKKK